MNVLPVIQRELQAASRRGATWHLRVAFACAAVLALGAGLVFPDVRLDERGQVVLVCLAVGGFALSLFTGAYLTADTLSAEKREGTLGLLFLTPLNGRDIVLGKMACHSLQVGVGWLAVFPMFYLPVMLGGVLWTEVGRLLLALLLTMALSIAFGMFWSTVCTEARTAVLATVVTMLLLALLPWLPAFLVAVFGRRGFTLQGFAECSPMTPVVQAFQDNYRHVWRSFLGTTPGAVVYWRSAAVAGGLSLALVFLSGTLLPRLWRRAESAGSRPARRRAPPAAWQERVRSDERLLALAGSPALWLAARGAAEARWLRGLRWLTLLFFGLMLFVSVGTRHWEEGFVSAMGAAYGLHLVVRIHAILTATRALHEDRRSGALELLLVTPLSEPSLLEGYQRSFVQALQNPRRSLLLMNVALQSMVIVFGRQLHMHGGEWAIFSAFFTGGFVVTLSDFFTLRWIGPVAALRATTHLRAAGRVFAASMLVPWLGFVATFLIAIQFNEEEVAAVIFASWAAVCVGWNALLGAGARAWLRGGIRRRVAEAG
ncbi:MAG: ABC transporter permease [Verrucomicrobiales bacterium]|nr:ABC transporter permease [Verrucomicrobiales bacterium]